MIKTEFNIGDQVIDQQTNRSGVVIGLAVYKFETTQYLVQLPSAEIDKLPNEYWISANRITIKPF